MVILQSEFWDSSLCSLCTIKTVSSNGNIYFYPKTVSKLLKVLSVVKEMDIPYGSERSGNDTIFLINLTGMENRIPNFCQLAKQFLEQDEVEEVIPTPKKKRTYYKQIKK